MYVCVCRALTERDVRRVARSGIIRADALVKSLGLDGDACCGRCARDVGPIVRVAEDEWARLHAHRGPLLTMHPNPRAWTSVQRS